LIDSAKKLVWHLVHASVLESTLRLVMDESADAAVRPPQPAWLRCALLRQRSSCAPLLCTSLGWHSLKPYCVSHSIGPSLSVIHSPTIQPHPPSAKPSRHDKAAWQGHDGVLHSR